MSWFYLLLAALFEVTWAVAMKYSNGFTGFGIVGTSDALSYCTVFSASS